MKKAIFHFVVLCLTLNASIAKSDTNTQLKQLNSIYMSLVGEPAPAAVVQKILANELSISDATENLKKDPRFNRRLAQYWTKTLGISSPITLSTIRDPSSNQIFATAALGGHTFIPTIADADPTNEATVTAAANDVVTRNFTRMRNNRNLTCPGGKRIENIYTGLILNNGNTVNNAIAARDTGKIAGVTVSDTVRAKYKIIADMAQEVQVCTCTQVVEVQPYWLKTGTVPVCRGITDDRFCGSDLSKCFADVEDQSTMRDPFRLAAAESFALEPGMMIAKIVSEDKSYDEVLRSKDGVANPTMIYTLKKYTSFWNKVLPPGSYPKLNEEPAIGKVDFKDLNYKWVERGPLHAGVLTTMALHRVTNGWRAKANRVMDAFMCRAFTVPDGIKVVPSEEAELIRMPYCQSCHATLEPLSQFFGRWPNLGNDSNYYYDPSAAVSSVGRLAGKEDADTRGLAFIMSSLPDYNECAVKRAFHFAIGREMTTYEEETILPSLTEKFVASGKKLWPIIRDFTLTYTQPIQ